MARCSCFASHKRSRPSRCAALFSLAAFLFFGVYAHAAKITTTVTGTFSQGTDVSGFFFPPHTDLTGRSYTLVYTMDDTQGVPIYGTWPADCDNGLQNSGLNTPVPHAVLTVNGKSYTFGVYPTTSISSYVYSLNATSPQTQISARIYQNRFNFADQSLWGSESAAFNIYLNSIYRCRSWESAFPGGTMGSYTLVPGKGDHNDGLVYAQYSNLNNGEVFVYFTASINVETVSVSGPVVPLVLGASEDGDPEQYSNLNPPVQYSNLNAAVQSTEGETARFPLGSSFYIQLLKSDAKGNKLPIASTFVLGNASITPAITGPTLFPNNVAIEFDRDTTATDKYFQAIHLGTVDLTITPTDSSISAVTVSIVVTTPTQLGKTKNTYDAALIKWGHQRGVPPHFLKGQVQKESNFNPIAFRYEPLSSDFVNISRGANLRAALPYSLYRLATSDRLAQGTNILTADISPRSKYYIEVGKTIRRMLPSDKLVSAENIYDQNDLTGAKENWSVVAKPSIVQEIDGNPALLNFTAQTPIASSYGLMQLLYSTAIGQPVSWKGINSGAKNPSYLFDTDANTKVGGGSVEPASYYLSWAFGRANTKVNVLDPLWTDPTSFVNAFINAFNYYNHNQKTGSYGQLILGYAKAFTPIASGSIF